MVSIMATTLAIGKEYGDVYKRHAGIKNSIKMNYREDVPAGQAAVFISAALLVYAIDSVNDLSRKQDVYRKLDEWSKTENPFAFRKRLREGTLDQDALLTRLQWAILFVSEMSTSNEIAQQDFDLFKHEIYGALQERTAENRRTDRIAHLMNGIFDTDKTSL